ncbi:hypothetical protein HID58_003176 [Brassica napus]|uniref:Uncharacterized protein n=1 Tax=Brassica napus TaxID=3708 RepID=A0ABQ8EPP0_BRANA|nr:hypothetical protein HID58_003176 [Brassica napus]
MQLEHDVVTGRRKHYRLPDIEHVKKETKSTKLPDAVLWAVPRAQTRPATGFNGPGQRDKPSVDIPKNRPSREFVWEHVNKQGRKVGTVDELIQFEVLDLGYYKMKSGKEESMHTYPLRSLASSLERGQCVKSPCSFTQREMGYLTDTIQNGGTEVMSIDLMFHLMKDTNKGEFTNRNKPITQLHKKRCCSNATVTTVGNALRYDHMIDPAQ